MKCNRGNSGHQWLCVTTEPSIEAGIVGHGLQTVDHMGFFQDTTEDTFSLGGSYVYPHFHTLTLVHAS